MKKIFEKIFTVNFIEKKFSNIFYWWIHWKKTSKNFYCWFHWKTFRKFLIVNFRLLKNFLLLNSLKKISKIFTVNFIEKKFRSFFRKSEKKFLPQKNKRGHRGGGGVKIRTIFPGKSDTIFCWVLMYGSCSLCNFFEKNKRLVHYFLKNLSVWLKMTTHTTFSRINLRFILFIHNLYSTSLYYS